MNFFHPIAVQASRPEEIEVSYVEMTESGLFFYQDQQLVIYIKNTAKKIALLKAQPEKANKFHLTNCTTIGNVLHSHSVLQRFIATARNDGLFHVTGFTETGELKECLLRLKVCRSCLFKLNYKKYAERDKYAQDNIVSNFDIQTFFIHCQTPSSEAHQTISSQTFAFLVHIYFTKILLKQASAYFFTHWLPRLCFK